MNTRRKTTLLFFLPGIVTISLFLSCATTRYGKVYITSETAPDFLQVGITRPMKVLNELGEPYGYRQDGNRIVMIYRSGFYRYQYFVIGSIRTNKLYRMDLVFENNLLSKIEVKKIGWGFAGRVNTQMMQILMRR